MPDYAGPAGIHNTHFTWNDQAPMPSARGHLRLGRAVKVEAGVFSGDPFYDRVSRQINSFLAPS
jgi:hypothetical protein